MRCNIEVDDLASVMQQNYETVQVSEGQCRDGEKVDGGNLLCMIGEKCLPGLRRRRAAPDSILRHSRFREVKTKKAKFRLDPRRFTTISRPDEIFGMNRQGSLVEFATRREKTAPISDR